MKEGRIHDRLVVKPGSRFRLAGRKPGDTLGVQSKAIAKRETEKNIAKIDELQALLYAENKHALLLVFQAMDAGGKDGAIRVLTRGMNPQGCRVTSFKAPSAEELDHDFLWRIHKALPGRGEIGIFNRSHYEDVLVVRVHELVPRKVWSRRYDTINRFEQNLVEEGTIVLKFFLHISPEEQRRRFQARIDDPTKHWKLAPGDFQERKFWDDYQLAYEEALQRCSTARAPWFVIPSDKKWFRDLAVSEIVRRALEKADMQFPPPSLDVAALAKEF